MALIFVEILWQNWIFFYFFPLITRNTLRQYFEINLFNFQNLHIKYYFW